MENNLQSVIKAKLKEKNISVRAFEIKAGLKVNAVRNILKGYSTKPSAETLSLIAKALDCALDDLLYPSTYGTSHYTYNKQVIDNYDLFQQVVKETLSIYFVLNVKPSAEDLCKNIIKIYFYCLEKKASNIDLDFIKWIVEGN